MKKQINHENLIVALDIGTTKICALIARKFDVDRFDIIGIGHAPSLGLSRGVVVDIFKAAQSIKQAIKEAEMMAGVKIDLVNVGISGSHIQSINSHGMIPIKKERVTKDDIENVINSAKAIIVPEGQQILHVLPQYFIIDEDQKISDPTGMFGVRLETRVHIITAGISSVQNIIRCCQLANLIISDIILEPLASADAVLSEDERQLGAGILDIGGGTSDFAIYQQGTIRYTKVFATAGNHVTQDIALCLRTTIRDAERVKRQFGRTLNCNEQQNENIEVECVQGGQSKIVKIENLVEIIESRVSELMHFLANEIDKKELKHLMPAGLVLTGGGSLLKDIDIFSERILNIPIRIGKPNVISSFKESLDNPAYATSYGLLLYVLKKSKFNSKDFLTDSVLNRVVNRMKSWFSDFF